MALDPDQYRLTEAEHQAIFEAKIRPAIFAETVPSNHPVAVIFGGQPGAGKSAAVAAAETELETRGGSVLIEGDALRNYHPAYARLMLKDDSTAAFYTDRDSGRWVEKAIAYAKAQRVNLVIEGTMRNPEVVASTMKALREAGYAIDARALAVTWRLSEQGIQQRYEHQKADRGVGRMTTPEAHKAAYDGMLDVLERIEREKLADRVTLYRRGNEAIYSNALEHGQWSRTPQARAVVEAERARPMTLRERQDYASGFDQLAHMLTRPERQASAEEVRRIEMLRQQAHALFAIEKNRVSLDLMERSYPSDHLKQIRIQSARKMLDGLDKAVTERSPNVQFSGQQTDPYAALGMIQPAIEAAEKSGVKVQHDLQEIGQVGAQHQREHGFNRT